MSERAGWAVDDRPKIRHVHVEPEETLLAIWRDTSCRFHDLMDSAMLVSGYKYGPTADAYPEKVKAVAITAAEFNDKKSPCSLERRLEMYRKTGNVEYLVDVANFAMIEFMHPRHPEAHYTPTDASGSPGRNTIAGNNQMNNKDLTLIANG